MAGEYSMRFLGAIAILLVISLMIYFIKIPRNKSSSSNQETTKRASFANQEDVGCPISPPAPSPEETKVTQ